MRKEERKEVMEGKECITVSVEPSKAARQYLNREEAVENSSIKQVLIKANEPKI